MSSILEEIHTTALTASCARYVQLSAEGKSIGETTSALYRGNLAHEVLRRWFCDHFDGNFPKDLARHCHAAVEAKAKAENRPLSEAVINNASTIQVEVGRLCENLATRWGQFHAGWKPVGAELPIRWEMNLPGFDEPVSFASHLDFVFKTPNGYVIPDVKTGEDDPSPHYLSRNLQFACYYLAFKYGSVRTNAEFDLWEEFDAFPSVYWLHFNSLAPYARKTTAADENGEQREYAAGSHRPWHRVMRPCDFTPEFEASILSEISIRVRMFRAGLFPTNPDPIGCRLCDANYHCPSFGRSI